MRLHLPYIRYLLKAAWLLVALFAGFVCSAQITREMGPPDTTLALIPTKTVKAGVPDTLDVHFERNFFHLDINDGLCSRSIRKVFIDSRDYLWIATNGGGVSVYNGKSFRNLTTLEGLPSEIVWDFEEDELGRIWIATDAGVCIYDGKEFSFISEEDGLASPYCWSVFRDSKNRMFIGTARGGFSVWENGKLTTYDEILGDTAASVKNFAEQKDGTIWMCTWNGAISWNGTAFTSRFLNTRSRYSKVVMDMDLSSYEDEGTMWFATVDGLFKVSATDTVRFGKDSGLPAEAFLDLFVDADKNLWIGSSRGVIRWDPNVPYVLSEKEGLPSPEIQSICQDRWGNLWIGTGGRGVVKYDSDRFTHLSENTGMPGVASTIKKDSQNSIWIGLNEKGIVFYDGIDFLHYGSKQGFDFGSVVSIAEDTSGVLWFGLKGTGLVKFDGATFYHYTNKNGVLPNQNIIDLEFFNGDLWLATWMYAHRISGDSIHIYNKKQNVVDHNIVNDFYLTEENKMWIGTFGGGASLISGNDIEVFKEEQGLPNSDVFSICEDRFKNTWFLNSATGVSVLKYGWEKVPFEQWTWMHFTTANGLPSNQGNFVFIAADGDAWVGTALGLSRIELRGKNIFSGEFILHNYREQEGFKGIASRGACLEDDQKKIWIVSDDIITVYNAAYDVANEIPPVLRMTDLKIRMKAVDWSQMEKGATYSGLDKWSNLPSDLKLAYENNHVMFDFLAVTFNSDQVEYSWQLEGLDSDWSPWSENQNATYANLPPGDYTFKLKARDYYGVESESLSYQFTIEKAYWHTAWFRAGLVLLVVLLFILIYKRRTISLKKRQRDLEDTVLKRTEEIQHQKEEIEAQQIEILHSITYAKRIQEAILPKPEFVNSILSDAFVFYRPRDIVAGDFFWIEKVGDEIFIAAADCTGHGVPGAMTSVVCSSAMNQAVLQEGIMDPGKILDRVTILVVERFKHGNERLKDGMDIALCRWNIAKSELVFAGAFNPLWKFSAGSDKIEEFEANKQPVGKFLAHEPFRSKKIPLKKGDRFYIFTDGYYDQFGGPSGKKFKSNNLKLLLGTLKDMTAAEQLARIEQVLDNWRGSFEQVDDVSVIGVTV